MKRILICSISAAMLGTMAIGIAGCGDSGGPEAQVDQGRVDKLTSIRTLFDKSKGDYNALSPADKAELLRLCDNDQAKVETTWNVMKTGPVPPGGGR